MIAQAGARLVEVGTTNRTRRRRLRARASGPRPGAILRAHPSNFRQLGFVQEVEIEELCELGVPVIDDVGSGVLADGLGVLADEPAVRRSVAAGAALVCFSGDKLLGGPQAGLIAGRARRRRARARRHPLARALRLDKLSLAALEATLRLYREPERALAEIPVLAMLDAGEDELAARAARLAALIGPAAEVVRRRRPGSAAARCRCWSCPGRRWPSRAPPDALAARLRAGDPPVVGAHRGRAAAARPAHARARRGRAGRPRGGRRAVSAPLTLGTAGHIDHGKTALVRALTGVDTDRLPRGARARASRSSSATRRSTLPSGRRLSVVDVPGHERFVRTMVAGATGIDLFLMVVAADDGVMPQTREHAAVLAALGVDTGVVAVTKSDVADPARALAEAAELLPGAEAVAVAAPSGAGLDALRRGARARRRTRAGPRGRRRRAAAARRPRVHDPRRRAPWSPARCGRAASRPATRSTILPAGVRRPRARRAGPRRAGRARGGGPARRAEPDGGRGRRGRARRRRRGRRPRGAAAPGPRASFRVDAALDWATPASRPAGGARVAVHHGTREVPARLAELGGRYSQLRLEQPLVPVAGDRAGHPLARAAGHARRRRRARRRPAPPRAVARPARPPRPAGARRAGARAAGARARPRPGAASRLRSPPAALAVEEELRAAGAEPPLDAELDAPDELAALRAAGRAVRLGPAMHIHPDALAAVRERLRALLEAEGEVTLARLRDELGTSRKYAQALLEHFDAERLTLRRGEVRVARRRALVRGPGRVRGGRVLARPRRGARAP